jgi:hypothetical protein
MWMTTEEREKENQEGAAKVESLVQRKIFLLGKYLALTEEMMACLEKKGVESLGALLARRQQCIEEVDRNDILLHKATPETAGEMSMKHDHARIRAILANVEYLEKELLRRMREASKTLKGEVLKMRTVRGATEKYRGHIGQAPRFLDLNR